MKIEAPIFEIIGETKKVIPQVILDKLHESEERKGLAVEARLVDKDEWHDLDTMSPLQCGWCSRWGTNPTNEPSGEVKWKTIEEFDTEERAEFDKALKLNPLLLHPERATGSEAAGQTTGMCPECTTGFLKGRV